ncbi:MAG: tRNA (adenosine(37)-N6)-threonylcarbamoyltransferase complex ATPase subunit type 1 TsaE [Alphaproteobacteria bacterium]|jgi:tRNA threonylcarbamoyladenosine biosynthesis protein TsaE|nr:tRNA (adenosine(37)-N6)-threonylcarbamoyltransferase complex ATPase subunit type 1 TsaE [Alphaproteobacteria bacterium]
MTLRFPLPGEADTRALGAALAGHLRAGDVIALHGGLGAGKTTLARGLVCALAGKAIEVVSPTFTLVQTYEAPGLSIWHFDLYRLESPDELVELGWQEAEDGLALVEWPERAGPFLPAWRLDLRLEPQGHSRMAYLEPRGEDWHKRLDGFQFRPS